MTITDIVALAIVGFAAFVLVGIASELLILVTAGAALWGWFVILSGGEATAVVWAMAVLGPVVTVGLIATAGGSRSAR